MRLTNIDLSYVNAQHADFLKTGLHGPCMRDFKPSAAKVAEDLVSPSVVIRPEENSDTPLA